MKKKYAIVFPGQGSQHPQMLSGLIETHPEIVKKTFQEASDSISLDLFKLVQEGTMEEISTTTHTQPLMLASDVSVFRVWRSLCTHDPVVLAGHSLGEYAALVAAESLSLTEATQAVYHRGKLMQSAVPVGTGAVAAILGLATETIETICQTLSDSEIVCPANYNSPTQTVISGHQKKVEQAMEAAKKMGAKRAVKLPLSVPVHCDLLKPIATRFSETLANFEFNPPKIDIMHNIDGKTKHTTKDIKVALVSHLYKPVRWVECVCNISSYGVESVVECGPGKVLSGLNRSINKQIQHFSVNTENSITNSLEYICQ